MSEEIQNYIKELIHLKNLGLVAGDEAEELDGLIEKLNQINTDEGNLNPNNNQEFNIPIKFVNKSDNPDPVYAKDGDSGFDLRANTNGLLKPLDRLLVPTGLYFDIPEGYDIDIKSRSGLAFKHGIGVLTGTIDQNYRGEIKVLLFNISNENFEFKKGDRIAQAIVRHRLSTEFSKMVKLNSIEDLSKTNRESNGFGSTGTK